MKVLRRVCPHCGYVMLFSFEVLCRPGTVEEFGRECPACKGPVHPYAVATEIDMEEVTDDPDLDAIKASVRRALDRS